MDYLTAVIIFLVILVVLATAFWGVPYAWREKPSGAGPAAEKETHGGWRYHVPVPLADDREHREHHGGWRYHVPVPLTDDREPADGVEGIRHAGPQYHTHPVSDYMMREPLGCVNHPVNVALPESGFPVGHPAREAFSSPGSTKEHYGEPPGMIRAVHRDELGFRGWSDMPGDYEGSSASALSAYVDRSA